MRLRQQNTNLVSQVRSLEVTSAPAVGSSISSLGGVALDGKPVRLDLAHRGDSTLLFIMSPSCPYCATTLPAWKSMTSIIGADNVVYVDVSGTITSAYLKGVGLESVPNIISLSPEEKLLHGFVATPTTVLIDKGGRVDTSWAGVLDEKELTTFNRALRSARQSMAPL